MQFQFSLLSNTSIKVKQSQLVKVFPPKEIFNLKEIQEKPNEIK